MNRDATHRFRGRPHPQAPAGREQHPSGPGLRVARLGSRLWGGHRPHVRGNEKGTRTRWTRIERRLRAVDNRGRFMAMQDGETVRKRCQRWNTPWQAHGLTFSCYRRQAFLSKDRTRGYLADAVNRARETHGFHVWAYVFMPEHVHLLIWPAGGLPKDTEGMVAPSSRSPAGAQAWGCG